MRTGTGTERFRNIKSSEALDWRAEAAVLPRKENLEFQWSDGAKSAGAADQNRKN
jgi:hypothetical protein